MKNDEDLIDELCHLEADGFVAGVFGREWCEVCGKEGSFTGFLGAMASHASYGRYVCSKCRPRARSLDQLIVDRGYRYCYFCGKKVTLPEPTIEAARQWPFSCEACEGIEVEGFARMRYLRHEATKVGGLEQAAARIRSAKTGIEAFLKKKPHQ